MDYTWEEKREAVRNTIKMWKWLAGYPDKEKENYFDCHPNFSRQCNNCFLCTIWCSLDGGRLTCKECPLAYGSRCELVENNIYSRWCKALTEDKPKYAKQLVKKCEEWLEKHKDKKDEDILEDIFEEVRDTINEGLDRLKEYFDDQLK
jgi:hypothetical protein